MVKQPSRTMFMWETTKLVYKAIMWIFSDMWIYEGCHERRTKSLWNCAIYHVDDLSTDQKHIIDLAVLSDFFPKK